MAHKLVAWAAGNSLVFGEYILKALSQDAEAGRWKLRLVGSACITFAFVLHGTKMKWGLYLQNGLGAFKFLVLLGVILAGFIAIGGHVDNGTGEKPKNFDRIFEGTTAR